MARTLLETAKRVAGATGLTPPVTLFGPQEGDDTARKLLEAAEAVVREHLDAIEKPPGYVDGSFGKTASDTDLDEMWTADSNKPWPPDEVMFRGMVLSVQSEDGMAREEHEMAYQRAVTLWHMQRSVEYTVFQDGMPVSPLMKVRAQ